MSAFDCATTRRHFGANEGTVAVLFALTTAALCLLVGAAIDVGRANSARTHLQDALDATVLSLAGNPALARSGEGQKILAANYSLAATSLPLSDPPNATFSVGADGTVTGSATANIHTAFLNLANLPKFVVAVRAKALAARQEDSSTLVFSTTNVKGWFAKDIYVIEKDANGKILQESKVLSYDYDNATETRTIVPPIGLATTRQFALDSTVVLRMRVWPDYPKSGSSRRTVKPVDYYSDDKRSALRRSGACDTGENHEWEDAPNRSQPQEDDFKDFIYTMTCASKAGEADYSTRLVE